MLVVYYSYLGLRQSLYALQKRRQLLAVKKVSLSLTSKHFNILLKVLFLFSIFNMKKLFSIVSPPTFHLTPRSLYIFIFFCYKKRYTAYTLPLLNNTFILLRLALHLFRVLLCFIQELICSHWNVLFHWTRDILCTFPFEKSTLKKNARINQRLGS